MKIEYLEIKNYKQFSDLKLELTYPQGHIKAEKPLDKVCIIGQSGTGKTNLLDIIKKSTIDFSEQNHYLPFSKFVGKDTDDRYITTKFITQKQCNAETLFTDKKSKITFRTEAYKTKNHQILENEKNYFISTVRNTNLYEEMIEDESDFDESKMSVTDKRLYDKLISAKANLVLESINEDKPKSASERMFEQTLQNSAFAYGLDRTKTASEKTREVNRAMMELEEKYTPISKSIKQLKRNNFLDRYIVNINDEVDSLWKTMKGKIDNYKIERDKYKDQLTNRLLSDDTYDKKHFKDDFQTWEKENENLLEKIADDINFILQKFNLELTKIDENQTSYNALTIKDLSNDTIIEYEDLSTGTKNLISTFIPLKIYGPKDSLILIDEPEMSFYPDIQKQLVGLYENVGLNNQLIVATHSPLIASSFEPWEIVELKFDKNHQIYRELYYKGENHIDNYFLDPRMLTWTSILTDIFDLKENSNFSVREKKLMEYATLKAEIKAMTDMSKKEKKFDELMKLSRLLGLSNNEKN